MCPFRAKVGWQKITLRFKVELDFKKMLILSRSDTLKVSYLVFFPQLKHLVNALFGPFLELSNNQRQKYGIDEYFRR